MSARWFRFYANATRNPKVARLSDKDFRLWVELMCVAAENDGHIPALDDLKHLLRRRLDHLKAGVDRLISALLIDALAHGYEPHNWSKFQYKSDSSTERVKRHREKRNVSETPPETETESETEKPPVSPPEGDGLTPDEVVTNWNELAAAKGLPIARKLTPARRRKLQVRLREYPEIEDWQRAFQHIATTPFLCGDNRTGWRADLDFLLQSKSFTKLTEEAYGKA